MLLNACINGAEGLWTNRVNNYLNNISIFLNSRVVNFCYILVILLSSALALSIVRNFKSACFFFLNFKQFPWREDHDKTLPSCLPYLGIRKLISAFMSDHILPFVAFCDTTSCFVYQCGLLWFQSASFESTTSTLDAYCLGLIRNVLFLSWLLSFLTKFALTIIPIEWSSSNN